MHVDNTPWVTAGITNAEPRIITKTSLLQHSSHMEIIWSLLTTHCVYLLLLLLLWNMTICCKSLSQQRNAQTHTQAHGLLAKLAAEPCKGDTTM